MFAHVPPIVNKNGAARERQDESEVAMKRVLVLAYGAISYAIFLGVFVYTIGFVGGFCTPTTLDAVLDDPSPWTIARSALVNLALVAAFGLQHSVMARPAFKRRLTRWIPRPIERSTYVLATNLVLGLLLWQWQPMGGIVWHVEAHWLRVVLWCLFAGGWLAVLVTTCLINHFDLFGLRQVWLYFRGRPYTPIPFVTPGPYRLVRHPLYLGWLTAFWCTPTMTVGHLVFASAMSVYILMAIRWEERDLLTFHRAYAQYRQRVPMLIPRWPVRRNRSVQEQTALGPESTRSVGPMHAASTPHEGSIRGTSTI